MKRLPLEEYRTWKEEHVREAIGPIGELTLERSAAVHDILHRIRIEIEEDWARRDAPPTASWDNWQRYI